MPGIPIKQEQILPADNGQFSDEQIILAQVTHNPACIDMIIEQPERYFDIAIVKARVVVQKDESRRQQLHAERAKQRRKEFWQGKLGWLLGR